MHCVAHRPANVHQAPGALEIDVNEPGLARTAALGIRQWYSDKLTDLRAPARWGNGCASHKRVLTPQARAPLVQQANA